MMFKKAHFFFALTIFTVLIVSATNLRANLLISPLQVTMEGRDRSNEIVLVNPSNDTNTYRISWTQLYQQEGNGGYLDATEEQKEQNTDLSDFAIFSPRQITLKPNETQVVRVGVRRPADLTDGEYKSHLRFEIIPSLSVREETFNELGEKENSLGAQIYTSYSIPIVYRSGSYDASFTIGEPSFSLNEKTSRVIVNVPITRTGIHGAVGQILVYYTPNGGERKLISQYGNASIFNEITTRNFKINTTESQLNPGTLLIQYYKAEGNKNEYTLLTEKSFPVR